jgi:sulfatase maturation enzyme AslB (radical SAM superfamily)
MAIFDLFGHVPMTAITNGSMRNTKFWADLARYQNLSVTFSIDGLEDTNHIYRINSNWHTIMSNAQAYIQAGGQAAWKFIVFQHNEHQIDTARAVSQQMGFKDFSIQHSGRSWFTGERWAVKIDGEYQYDLLPSSEIALENGVSTSPTFDHIARIVPKENIVDQCHIVRKQRLYINHLGHVLPCCMVSGQTWRTDIQAQLWQQLVGDLDAINITKRSLKSIAATEFYQHRLKTSLSSSRRHPVCTTFCG